MTRGTVAIGLALAVTACGASRHATTPTIAATPGAPSSTACQTAAGQELARVARRIYEQAVSGRNLVASVKRIQHSRPLAAAVAQRDPRAIAAALPKVVRHQVVRLVITDAAGRTLARYGRPVAAFAPRRGTLRDASGATIGHYLLTVTDDRAYIGLVRRITGADVMIRSAGRRVMGTLRPGPRATTAAAVTYGGIRYQAFSIAARAYPSGPLTIMVLVPRLPATVCGTDDAATKLRTIGYVGERLFAAEQRSSSVTRTLHYAAADPVFRAAVAAGDPAAIRAAVVDRFFPDHRFHIVRVRVARGGQVIQDVGGPYALAPASIALPGGTVTLSVQDDTGYIKLMHRFTGAAVQLRMNGATVPGSTLAPGPSTLPAFGPVTYAGRTYMSYAFTAVAFPSGPLDIGLLVPVA